MFHFLQIRALAKHFEETLLSAHNGIKTFLITLGNVASGQGALQFITFLQILWFDSIAQHDILAVIYQLTHFACNLYRISLVISKFETTSRNGYAHTTTLSQTILRRQVSHACRSFRGAIHDEEALALFLCIGGKLLM